MTAVPLNLQDCALSDLGTLRYSFARGVLPVSRQPLLVIRLEGTVGNENSEAFDLASALVMAGLEAWQPWAVILDLRALAYSWGDEMENVLNVSQRWYLPLRPLRRAFAGSRLPERFPQAVLVSDLCRDGLSSLLSYMNLNPDDILFESTEDAAGVLDQALEGVPLI